MLVAKFNCPQCDAVLKPSSPQPEGKKVKCPKCGSQFEVASPDVEEVEEIEEVEEVKEKPAKRTAARDEDEDRPRRRSNRDEEQEEEEERPRKRRARAGKGRGGWSGATIGLVIGGSVVVMMGLLVGGCVLFWPRSPMQVHHQAYQNATTILAGVTDEATGRSAQAKLVAVGQRLHDITPTETLYPALFGYKDKLAFQAALDEGMRDREKGLALAAKMEKFNKEIQEVEDNLSVEVGRVIKLPGGRVLLSAFFDAWGPGPGRERVKVLINSKVATEGFRRAKENMSKVEVGMTAEQVLDLLGPPSSTHMTPLKPKMQFWTYPGATLEFTDRKLTKKTS